MRDHSFAMLINGQRVTTEKTFPVINPEGAPPGDAVQWPTWYRFLIGVFDDPNKPFNPPVKVSRGWAVQPTDAPAEFRV